MAKNFWKGKKVLVTGASGFIGSWLTEALVARGARVTALARRGDPFRTDAIAHLKNKIALAYGDVREKEKIKKLVKGQDMVFHLAAITQVLYSIRNPAETVEVNMLGTQNVLEGIRSAKNKPFLVFVSTDKVYGEPEYLPLDERHPLSAKSPYDASKVGADRLVFAYHKTYDIRAAIMRWANTYGGRDANKLRAVPDFVTSVLAGKPPLIRGNGKHTRDFLYVSDVVSALLLAAEKQDMSNGHAFNLGTKKQTSIKDLADLHIELTGLDLQTQLLGNDTPGEIDHQYLAYEKAKQALGWEPTVDLAVGLAMTLDWYRQNPSWKKVMDRVHAHFA